SQKLARATAHNAQFVRAPSGSIVSAMHRIGRFAATGAVLCALAVLPRHGLSALTPNDDELTTIFAEWRAFQQPKRVNGVPDYSAAAMDAQRRALPALRHRVDAIDPSSWPIPQQV